MDGHLLATIVIGAVTALGALVQLLGGFIAKEKITELKKLRDDVGDLKTAVKVIEKTDLKPTVDDHANRLGALEGALREFATKLGIVVEFVQEERKRRTT